MPVNVARARAPRYVIVGSGIAGLAAAEALRERQPKAEITMVSEESHNFYSRPALPYVLRGDIPEKQLFIRNRDDLRSLNVNRIHSQVEQLSRDSHELILAGGKRLPYDRLLLATGALATRPPFITEDLIGLVKLDSLDDTRLMLKQARRGKTAVVVGGGITALELAEGLAARRMQTHYFLRGDRYWSDVLDDAESKIILDRLRHEGVILHLNTQVKQLKSSAGKLTGVETETGEVIPCHMLAYAIGVRPRIDLAKNAGMKVDKGILVNEFLHTSRPGVYAAGDAAQVGNSPLDVLWPTALNQGRIAGANMAGEKRPYVKGVACNVTMLTGLKLTIIGNVGRPKDGKGGSKKDEDTVAIVRGDSESWRVARQAWVLSDEDDVNRVRLFVGERRLVGALVMGDQTWSHPLQRLITAGVDITPIREQLSGASALEVLAEFYVQWETAGRGAMTNV
jgi:nitrite reductase (NADH) large subunit